MAYRRVDTQDEEIKNIQDAAQDAFNEIDTTKPFGSPEQIWKDGSMSFGKIYYASGNSANITLTLPSISNADLGKITTVYVNMNSLYSTTIVASGATIDGQSSVPLAAGQNGIFVAVSTSVWVVL